ncbi:hypothetical protein KJ780_01860, partial [Candidatus Micrarchaeota archaeon]|nr:hypothetical protein [Candidatus Micrarchaeota archaeon]
MAKRIEIKLKSGIKDTRADAVLSILKNEFESNPIKAEVIEAFNIDADLSEEELDFLGKEVFSDKIIQEYSYREPFCKECWRIEIGFKPGVTDNVGKTSKNAIKDALGKEVEIYTSIVYAVSGEFGDFEEKTLEAFGKRMSNGLVQNIIVQAPLGEKYEPYVPKVVLNQEAIVEKVKLPSKDDELAALSKKRLLALSVDEMKTVRAHFSKKGVMDARKKVGLDSRITDVELE